MQSPQYTYESNSLLHPESHWPRRLLHVPSMTSLEWSAGNMYGSYMEPAYNILTYTWGRWQLREGPSLAIKGVSWKVPAVDEAHFTVDGLSRVIQRVSRGVSFVWIDVACIDHENRAAMMEEVGK